MTKTWAIAWQFPTYRVKLIFASILLAITVSCFPLFFPAIEKRQGILLNDWLLQALPPHNVSIPIFLIIWLMLILLIIRAVSDPDLLLEFMWAYVFLSIARLCAIELVSLEPPAGLIPLTDPISDVFYGGHFVTRDLFFSGHTATIFLMFLCFKKKTDKILSLLGTIGLAILLLLQHVHYTIDVLFAPVFAYLIWQASRKWISHYS